VAGIRLGWSTLVSHFGRRWIKITVNRSFRHPKDKFGGNGGFSLRHVSAVRKILQVQNREKGSKFEDKWLADRIALIPGIKMANLTVEVEFSVEESVQHATPLGYHIGTDGMRLLPLLWDDPVKRAHVYEYCPEIKMILQMVLEREACKAPGGAKSGKELMAEMSPEELANRLIVTPF
jgi:Protein of unknown function (DUF5672)